MVRRVPARPPGTGRSAAQFTGYATLAAFAESRRQSLAPFFYLSRGLSAVMDTLTVWWIYDLDPPRLRRHRGDRRGAVSRARVSACARLPFRGHRCDDGGVDRARGTRARPVAQSGDPLESRDAGLPVACHLDQVQRARRLRAVCGRDRAARGGIPLGVRGRMAGKAGARARRSLARHSFRLPDRLFRRATSPSTGADFSAMSRASKHLHPGSGDGGHRGWWHHAAVTLPAALGWPIYLSPAPSARRGCWQPGFGKRRWSLASPLAYYVRGQRIYRVLPRAT